MNQRKLITSLLLRQLGLPRCDDGFGSLTDRGISQADFPTNAIAPPTRFSRLFRDSVWPLVLKSAGDIIFPIFPDSDKVTFEGLAPPMIKIARIIEDLDRPSEGHYDSELKGELPMYTEATMWDQDAKCLEIESPLHRHPIRHLTTDGISFHWSVCNYTKKDSILIDSSETMLLMRWISERKAAFLITAYQTYANAKITENFTDSTGAASKFGVRLSRNLPGQIIAAICVREVKVLRSPYGEDTLKFGNNFWRVYWGLVTRPASASQRSTLSL